MKYLLSALLCTVALNAVARDVYVDGYVRKDGTYVQPHHRTAPDHNQYNNYGTQGNTNPWTGQQGHVQPQPTYQQPTYQQPTYQPYQPYQPPCYGYGCNR